MGQPTFLLGHYVPGTSFLHRTPFLVKLAAVTGIGVVAYLLSWLAPAPWIPLLVLLSAVLVVFALCRLPVGFVLRPLRVLLPIAALLVLYQALAHGWGDGVGTALSVILTLLSCVYAASLVSLTSTVNQILDGLSALIRPLRVFGADEEKFALTVAILIRSVPALIAAFIQVHQAAKARGLQRSIRAHLVPTLVATVALAQQTGEALVARGLGD